MKKYTIRDVAKRAGVGLGTASRVLNNSERVSPQTRERVLKAIHELNFRPDSAARQLAGGFKHRNIGIVSPFLAYYSFVETLAGMQEALADIGNGFNLVLYNVSGPDRIPEVFASIIQQRLVDGVLFILIKLTDEQLRLLREAGIAVVLLAERCSGDLPCLGPDNVWGGQLATEHLLNLGHRRVAYVGDAFPNPFMFPTSEDRHAGYVAALNKYHVPVVSDYFKLGPHGRDVAYSLTTDLLRLADPPTAIFAMSDVQAMGCVAAIRDAGLTVPNDISVIGFDDIELSQFIGLTTIRHDLKAAGRVGMQTLINLLTGETHALSEYPQLELVIRNSTAPVQDSSVPNRRPVAN